MTFSETLLNLNQSRLDRLDTSVKAVTDFLKRNLSSFMEVERQGSYGLKTIIRPVKEGQEYDADITLYMKYDKDKKPEDYINDLYNCFRDNGTYKDKVHRRTRCVYLDYAGDFHLDIVPCITKADGSNWVCNNKTNKFERTDGTGYRDWFNEKTRITHGNLKRVTRLLKFLRDHKGNFTAKSILLTTLIGMMVYGEEDREHSKYIPDALKTVSNRINDFLQSHPIMPTITNPVLPRKTSIGTGIRRSTITLGKSSPHTTRKSTKPSRPKNTMIVLTNGGPFSAMSLARSEEKMMTNPVEAVQNTLAFLQSLL